MNKEKEFNIAMNALLLEVDESIVRDIRRIGHEYAAEVSRERINDAWLRGFNEGRLAHPRKERKEKKCTCGGYPDCICKEQEEL